MITNGDSVVTHHSAQSHDGDTVGSEVRAAQAVVNYTASNSHSTTRAVIAGNLIGTNNDVLQHMS